MKVLNFGSLNIDHVYRVEHFARPGETISANQYSRFRGGKGLNQSVALIRAGAKTEHAGRIGRDGLFLKEYLESAGVGCGKIEVSPDEPSGHAVIQVDRSGENCIIIHGGTNRNIPDALIRRAFDDMGKGDFLLLQNEIAPLGPVIRAAAEKGMRIFFNPAPMDAEAASLPLDRMETLIVNETEGAALAGLPAETAPERILDELVRKYPGQDLLMTLGSAGALWRESGSGDLLSVPACRAAKVVDTTAAGDTFIGYFLASLSAGMTPEASLKRASAAAAICVSRPGAADSIPYASEVTGF